MAIGDRGSREGERAGRGNGLVWPDSERRERERRRDRDRDRESCGKDVREKLCFYSLRSKGKKPCKNLFALFLSVLRKGIPSYAAYHVSALRNNAGFSIRKIVNFGHYPRSFMKDNFLKEPRLP